MGWAIELAGGALQAGAANKQGQRDEITGKENAALAEMQADDALQRGVRDEQIHRRKLARLVGTQRNEIGARNVQLNGSALRLLEDTAMLGEEDAIAIRNDAAREAWGYRQQADESRRWGGQSRRNAQAQAGGSLLTSGAQAYGTWRESRSTT